MNTVSAHFPTFRRWLQDQSFASSISLSQHGLLDIIASASQHRKRLAPLLTAFARDNRGPRRRQLLQLADHLEAGLSLADGLERIPDLLPESTILALRLGTDCGMLPYVLREIKGLHDPSQLTHTQYVRRAIRHFQIVGLGILLVATFLNLKVLPTFKQISQDFHQPVVQNYCAIEWIAAHSWTLFVGIILLSWFALGQRWGRRIRWSLLMNVLPPLTTLRNAEIVRYLAWIAACDRPVPAAVSCLAKHHYDPAMRYKLLVLRNEMELGAESWPMMQQLGFITPQEATALQTAEACHDLLWVAMRIADAKRERALDTLAMLASTLPPLGVLVTSSLVLLMAYWLFHTLSSWIVNLA